MGHNRKLTALDGNHPNSTNPYRGDQVNFIVHQQEPITSDRLLASTKPHPQPPPPLLPTAIDNDFSLMVTIMMMMKKNNNDNNNTNNVAKRQLINAITYCPKLRNFQNQ